MQLISNFGVAVVYAADLDRSSGVRTNNFAVNNGHCFKRFICDSILLKFPTLPKECSLTHRIEICLLLVLFHFPHIAYSCHDLNDYSSPICNTILSQYKWYCSSELLRNTKPTVD